MVCENGNVFKVVTTDLIKFEKYQTASLDALPGRTENPLLSCALAGEATLRDDSDTALPDDEPALQDNDDLLDGQPLAANVLLSAFLSPAMD
jgi:hypothetical protein